MDSPKFCFGNFVSHLLKINNIQPIQILMLLLLSSLKNITKL